MHIFHSWSKWSKVKVGLIGFRSGYGEVIPATEQQYQDRECTKCGKIQWRIV